MRKALLCAGVAAAALLPGVAAASGSGSSTMIPALRYTVYPGETITEDMLTMKPLAQTPGAGSFAADKESVIGKAARRVLLPGQPIPRGALREPLVILQGKTVPLIFQSANITITGIALALESGSVGDIISARNPDSGVVIRGTIQPDGSLRAQ